MERDMKDINASILIVEDDESLRTSLAQVFTILGYRARWAGDGLAALIAMRQEVPDILLSDLNMPVMSGFELLSVVRRRFPAMHVIAMSGAFYGEGIPSGVAADNFYQKGSGVAALLQAIETKPLSKREQRDTTEPIWIQRNGHDASGGEFVTIVCPDCFRTFPQAINGTASLIVDATCVFCQNLIPYAIVAPLDLEFPQRMQPAPRFASPRIQAAQPSNRSWVTGRHRGQSSVDIGVQEVPRRPLGSTQA
jgi:CheY-like chemotaxis protein